MRSWRAAAPGALLAAVVLAGCTAPTAEPAPTPAPVERSPVERPAGDVVEPVELRDVAVPVSVADAVPVAPGWTSRPVEVGDTFVGVRDDGDGAQVLSVDATGTVLWEARRAAGTALVPTRADDRPVLVLTHDTADGDTVAEAVDPTTGATLWGPVPVPGSLVGPGLVVDEGARRMALDPATGDPVGVEDPDGAVVLERDGLLVLDDGASLRAVPAAQPAGPPTWSTARADLGLSDDGALAALPDARPPAGTAILGTAPPDGGAPATGTLVDLADGSVVATGVVDARADAALGTVVALAPGRLSGHAPVGSAGDGAQETLWSRDVPDGTRLSASTGALAYLRVGDAVLAVNTQTGADAVAYEDVDGRPLAVPAVATPTGAVVVRTDRWVLLAPAP